MNNYQLINERWQAYLGEQTLEEQFNRELNKLLKELQVLSEQNEPGIMGKIGQKVGQFVKSSLDKILGAVKKAPGAAFNIAKSLLINVNKFIRNPKVLAAVKAVGLLAIVAATLYTPEARAAIIDPDTGNLVGAGGNEAAAQAYVGALASITDILEKMVRTDIDIKAAALKDPVLGLISKINKPEVVDLTNFEKEILSIAKRSLRIIMNTDKHFGNTDLTDIMMDYGKKFNNFIITKLEGVTTHYKGKLPGTGKGIPRDVADITQTAIKPGVQKFLSTIKP